MKLLYTLLLSLALTSTYTAAAQTETQPAKQEKLTSGPEYDKYYEKLKELFIQKINSNSYQIYISASQNYRNKWKSVYDGTPEELAKDAGALKWLKENWERTEFKSYEEAQKEYKTLFPLHLAVEKENKEFEIAKRNAILKHGFNFYHELYLEIMMEYPDKF